jgi:nucleotide-binding universal stress UspA family protein
MSSQQSIGRILVPIDGSENAYRAASFAIDIAKRYGAEVLVIHVVQLNPNLAAFGVYGISLAGDVAKMRDDARKEVAPWFERVKKEADASQVKMQSDIIAEYPLTLAGEILDYAEKNHVDLIVMGSRGRTGFKKMLLGSVASNVVTYASCPVLVTK